MKVQLLDPSAFTPPYDHALSAALARAGADVELVTSRFLYGPVPREDGYRVTEAFYRRVSDRGLKASGRRALKLAEHVPDMLRARSLTADADVVHWQWVTVPGLDAALLPPARPRAYTVHYPLPDSRSTRPRARPDAAHGRGLHPYGVGCPARCASASGSTPPACTSYPMAPSTT